MPRRKKSGKTKQHTVEEGIIVELLLVGRHYLLEEDVVWQFKVVVGKEFPLLKLGKEETFRKSQWWWTGFVSRVGLQRLNRVQVQLAVLQISPAAAELLV